MGCRVCGTDKRLKEAHFGCYGFNYIRKELLRTPQPRQYLPEQILGYKQVRKVDKYRSKRMLLEARVKAMGDYCMTNQYTTDMYIRAKIQAYELKMRKLNGKHFRYTNKLNALVRVAETMEALVTPSCYMKTETGETCYVCSKECLMDNSAYCSTGAHLAHFSCMQDVDGQACCNFCAELNK